MLTPSRELESLKFLDNLSQYLRSIREPRKALGYALRESRAFFQATHGCVAVTEDGEPAAQLLLTVPRGGSWDLAPHRPVHPSYTPPGTRGRDDGSHPAAGCRMGRDGVHAGAAGFRPR